MHTYLPPESFGGFLADIGGHLGLFLGWSAYTLVEIIQGWIAERKKFRDENKEEEKSKHEAEGGEVDNEEGIPMKEQDA